MVEKTQDRLVQDPGNSLFFPIKPGIQFPLTEFRFDINLSRLYRFMMKLFLLVKKINIVRARVAKLANALDLGSSGFVPWGFKSPLSHQLDGLRKGFYESKC